MSENKIQPTVHNWSETIKRIEEFTSTHPLTDIEQYLEELFMQTLHSTEKGENTEVELSTLYSFKKELLRMLKELYKISPEELTIN
jgi:hypothetical protein